MRRYLALAILVSLALLMATQLPVFAQSPRDAEAMFAANQLYESGRFAASAQAYQQLVDRGYRDSALYYNLGNAHYKQGDLGRAVLSYLRAERLDPRDADIQANLEVARGQTIDVFDTADDATLASLARAAQSWLTLNEVAAITLGLWFLLAALLIALSLSRSERFRGEVRYAAIVAALLMVIGVVSLGTQMYGESARLQEAVIVAESVDVVSGPGPQYVTEFTLHGGTEASLIERRGNWARLALPGGQLQGWVPVSAVEEVG